MSYFDFDEQMRHAADAAKRFGFTGRAGFAFTQAEACYSMLVLLMGRLLPHPSLPQPASLEDFHWSAEPMDSFNEAIASIQPARFEAHCIDHTSLEPSLTRIAMRLNLPPVKVYGITFNESLSAIAWGLGLALGYLSDVAFEHSRDRREWFLFKTWEGRQRLEKEVSQIGDLRLRLRRELLVYSHEKAKAEAANGRNDEEQSPSQAKAAGVSPKAIEGLKATVLRIMRDSAATSETKRVQAKQIADSIGKHQPVKSIYDALGALKRAGLVESKGGGEGGYWLTGAGKKARLA